MKTRNYIIATLLVAVTIATVGVSCKKETVNTLNPKANYIQSFDMR